jgi:hypothetical protein
MRVSSASATNETLMAEATFASGTATANGIIWARRAR